MELENIQTLFIHDSITFVNDYLVLIALPTILTFFFLANDELFLKMSAIVDGGIEFAKSPESKEAKIFLTYVPEDPEEREIDGEILIYRIIYGNFLFLFIFFFYFLFLIIKEFDFSKISISEIFDALIGLFKLLFFLELTF